RHRRGRRPHAGRDRPARRLITNQRDVEEPARSGSSRRLSLGGSMRSRHRSRIVMLCIPLLFIFCGHPDLSSRVQHDDVPPGPSPEEINRCTADPLKNCQPAPPELAAKIKDPDNLTADDLKLLDEAGAVTDGQLKKVMDDLDKAALQFKADVEA